MRAITLLLLTLSVASSIKAAAQDLAYDGQLEARIWLDRGEEPVVQPGDRVRVYYRTSEPAYAAIFRINTDGVVSLLLPQHPDADTFVLGGRDFRLLFPRSPEWRVEEAPGVGYFFIVASPEPLDFSEFSFSRTVGWDLSAVGDVVYDDPYLAIDEFVARMIPDWEVIPYALDFITYNVGDTHTYPRFLCYDCHGFQSYARWNPYAYSCSTYQIVVWDDPYFYPAFRYYGTRVVYAAPIRNRPRYAVATRVSGAGAAPLVRVREAPPTRTEFKEPGAVRGAAPPSARRRNAAPAQSGRAETRGAAPSSGGTASPSRVPAAGRQVRPPATATTRQAAPTRATQPGAGSTRPTLRRRPSSPVQGRNGATTPGRQSAPAGARTAPAAGSSARVVTPARPGTQPRAGTARPSPGPGGAQAAPSGARPSTRPSVRPPRGTARPAPGATRGSLPSSVRPSTRPSTRPTATPSRPPARSVRPSTGGRPGASSSRPSTRPAPARPTVRPRPPPRRPGGGR